MIRINVRGFDAIRSFCVGAIGFVLIGLQASAALAQTSGTWAKTATMRTAREHASATLLQNGQVLVAGGADALGASNDTATAELFDAGHWIATGSMNTARDSHTATLLSNGQVLVAGGTQTDPNFNHQIVSTVELYNAATGTWSITGTMKTPRAGQTATLLPDGQVLVTGGQDASGPLASAELYNPATGQWTHTGKMSASRVAHTATLLPDGQVLVAGGFGQGFASLSSAELYNPATGAWKLTAGMNTARYGHAAVLLADGQVLVLDGIDYSSSIGINNLHSTELYNPATGTWTVNGNTFQSGDSGFSVTLLGTGKILIAGGVVGVYPNQHISNGAELYDPSTGASVFTGAMNTPRVDHSATLLANGEVLAAGGESTSQKTTIILNSTELYTP